MLTFKNERQYPELVIVTKNTDSLNKYVEKGNGSLTFISEENKYYLYIDAMISGEHFYSTLSKFVLGNKKDMFIEMEKVTSELKHLTHEQVLRAVVYAMGVYSVEPYSKKTKKPKEVCYNIIQKKTKFVKDLLIHVEATNFSRLLQDMPQSELNSLTFCEIVSQKAAEVKGLKITILEKEEIEEAEMGLLLSVNSGSTIPPRVLILEYKGDANNKEKVGLIGKGVTFDTGGYSLKSDGGSGMKYDMGGGAAVAGAMIGITQLRPKTNIAAVIGLTDNKVSADAVCLGDIMYSMNGKTVEMANTDAEGRLVMADCITYAIRKLDATKIINCATLTGACVMALGTQFTGIWATNDSDWEDMREAGEEVFELNWRLPHHRHFKSLMQDSRIADLTNSPKSRWGGASSAAAFMNEFCEGLPHLHCDLSELAPDLAGGLGHGTFARTLMSFLK